MTADAHSPAPADPPAASSPAPQRKPRLALFVATAAGLGYLPLAPGTWGSLGGLLLTAIPLWALTSFSIISDLHINATVPLIIGHDVQLLLLISGLATITVAAIGVWSADRAATFWHSRDPQRVVIDEVSGQHLAAVSR